MIVILEEKRSAAASMYICVGALVRCLLHARHDDDAVDDCGKPVENYGNNRGDKKPIAKH